MVGYVRNVEKFDYRNPGTGDQWHLVWEEYDTEDGFVECYLTVSYILPKAFREPLVLDESITVDMLKKVLGLPGVQLSVNAFDAYSEIPNVRKVFRQHEKVPAKAVRDTRVLFFRRAISFIHDHDILGLFPQEWRALAELSESEMEADSE